MAIPLTLAVFGALLLAQAGPTPSARASQTAALQAPGFVRVYAEDTPGLVAPKVRRQPSGQYTVEAMRARVKGIVEVDVTVGTDGRVTDVMVRRSIDRVHGLDEQAVMAAARWEFVPGTLDGAAVPVRMTVSVPFRIH
jgi:protein TonB